MVAAAILRISTSIEVDSLTTLVKIVIELGASAFLTRSDYTVAKQSE